jgi:alginate O-acetyltransferase complex protein AlgI
MLFGTPEFAIFLLLVLAVYFNLGHRAQNVFLLVASYVFYGWWDYRFLSLLWFTTVLDYNVGRWIQQRKAQQDPVGARRVLLISLVANLAVLGFFKYFNFFIDSAETAFGALGLTFSWPILHIVLPVGVSFYTFQSISYVIDVYRGDLAPAKRLQDFALYVAFFPHLVAGPIQRTNLLGQIEQPRIVTTELWRRGWYLIVVGLLRKMVIADQAAPFVDQAFANPELMSGSQLAAGLGFYALQIYGDFAGYTDIARGTANLMGFTLMRNFQHPYFARNISDFWRRWHISLSTWLRDYLYIPLGGNRLGPARTKINLMITMLLGGLWHGAAWTFVLWGGLHGAYLAVYQWFKSPERRWARPDKTHGSVAGSALAIGFTFCLVALTWLFFRAPNMATAFEYLQGLAYLPRWLPPEVALRGFVMLGLLAAITLLIDLPQALTDDEYCWLRLGDVQLGVLTGAAVILIVLSGGAAAPFIYFQF